MPESESSTFFKASIQLTVSLTGRKVRLITKPTLIIFYSSILSTKRKNSFKKSFGFSLFTESPVHTNECKLIMESWLLQTSINSKVINPAHAFFLHSFGAYLTDIELWLALTDWKRHILVKKSLEFLGKPKPLYWIQ